MKRHLLPLLLISGILHADTIEPVMAPNTERPWIGKEFWANPAEDWNLSNGRIINRFSGGNRNAVILTAEVGPAEAAFTFRVRIDQVSFETTGEGFVGMELGRKGRFNDFRDSAIYGVGLMVGVDFKGRPFIGFPEESSDKIDLPLEGEVFEFKAKPAEDGLYDCTLNLIDVAGKTKGTCSRKIHGSYLEGLVAVTASSRPPRPSNFLEPRPENLPAVPTARGGEARFAFSDILLNGDKVIARPEQSFGPIAWCTHTLDNNGILRLLVQSVPMARESGLEVSLELGDRKVSAKKLDSSSRTALFRVLKVSTDQDTPYKVTLAGDTWEGIIPALPKKGEVVITSLSCNDSSGFPHNDLVENVRAQDPDLITFHGDQIYEGIGGYNLIYDQRPNDRAVISYLRKYYMHGWTWREILRNTPSITIPDDHDVFHGNLWGAGGKAADITRGFMNPAQDSGGYKMSVEFVNAVHRSQTGNLPEPADPSPCRSGISVYFTRFLFGPLDMVVLSDRQFKSAPAPLYPKAEIVNGWVQNLNWNPIDDSAHPEAELLGARQETFLRNWAKKPAEGSKFRVAISQSPWCAPQTLPTATTSDADVPGMKILKHGDYAPDDEPKADFDTNGWPQNKQKLALSSLKQAKAVHITGDQHLGTTGQYGIETWGDGPWWISSPAIANIWPRRWMPAEEGKKRRSGDPKHLGDFRDGFGNAITLHAVANPKDIDREPARLFDRAVGYVVTRWNPANGQTSLEAWPFWASPAKPAPDNQPYPGWPVVIEPASGKRVK
ncbi:alkaline phosphatase D family protein [Haloferula sp.]|uniref:alkaline phosphatase D family protein n=1 Tax=Haloferula sp. TaxID=2497595 RepID=UPI0032A0D766